MEKSTTGIQTILRGVVGSQAYGLAHAGSDIDRMGVFVAPTVEIAGLNWHPSKDSVVDQGPDGDDFAAHEVGKFIRLVLKVNPTVTELLWLKDYEIRTALGDKLVRARELFLSEPAVRSAYLGYANAQFQKFAQSGVKKRKHARHCLRLLRQGVELLETGKIEIEVPNPQEYFDMDGMTDDQVIRKLDLEFAFVEDEKLPKLKGKSMLPLEPDRQEVSLLLQEIRVNCLF